MKSISETSNACPACPVEVRDLFAVAHNIIVRMPGIAEGDLKRAVENMQPLIDRHFADRDHSHPRGQKATAPTGSVEGIDLDTEIERAALKHVAPLFGKIGPGGDYKETEQFSRLKSFTLELFATSRSAAGGGWDSVPQPWIFLYSALNHMMARLGANGEIDARSTEADAVMAALHAIDGGLVSERALELHEKASMPLFNAVNQALRELGPPTTIAATPSATAEDARKDGAA